MPQGDYALEAGALDREILDAIERGAAFDFNALALRIFAHQLRYNRPYAQYCAALGVTLQAMPESWEQIPAVPSAAFKEAALCTFDPARAGLIFETSGTTQGVRGRHYMEAAVLYDATLLAGFKTGMLAGAPEPIRFLNVVPDPRERPSSSLGYMMGKCSQRFGDGADGWFLHGDELDAAGFARAVNAAMEMGRAVCIAGTAFALVQLADTLDASGAQPFALTAGSRIMETGGFKGRTRTLTREELYARLAHRFTVGESAIFAEYGMTELTSQYYDRPASAANAPRVKAAPPWLRPRVVNAAGDSLARGTVGALVHVDLANRSSCIAIQTEDLGVQTDDGIVLIGREHGAELRGCSLDAEQLRALQHV